MAMENIKTLCTILIVALLVPACTPVNIAIYTNGNPQCHEDTLSNCTLDAGLRAAQQLIVPVTITIQPGRYTLHSNTSCVYHNRSDIQIVGQDSPVVNCLPGTGCSFYECQNINVDDVTFIGCGAVHDSTSRNFRDRHYSLMEYQVALYFELCLNITVVHVSITNSNGMGLVLINSAHHVSITDSWFVNNTVAREIAGGGGVYVEFSECKPGNVSCANDSYSSDVPSAYTSASDYEFSSCHFVNNSASGGGFKVTHIIHSKNKSDHYVFGRGGGLLVYFKGNASDNNVSLSSCEFEDNQANLGAGLFASFSDKSHNNSFSVTDTNFINNTCYKASILPDNLAAGGGMKVNFGSSAKQNGVFIQCCNFSKNIAAWAGGLSIYAKEKHEKKALRNHASINGCLFESNIARIGAAIDFLSSSTLEESSLIPTVEACNFTNNGGLYEYINGSKGATFGTVNVERMPVTFKGITLFTGNVGSALLIQSSDVNFTRNTPVHFESNVGRIGAGIALLGTSWIGVDIGTRLVFKNNTAVEKGGAIYAGQTMQHYAAYSRTCFIRYSDPFIPPWKGGNVVWESFFTFSNNTVLEKPNAIFASSVLPCVWPTSLNSSLEKDISETFCNWSNWEFIHSNCSEEVVTSAGNFNSSKGYTISVVPGWKTKLNAVVVFDDNDHDVTNFTIFSVFSDNYPDNNSIEFQYTSDNSITVYSKPNQTTTVALETIDNRNIYTHINVSISNCPPGFYYNSSIKSCVCLKLSFATSVICMEGVHEAFIFVGYCISYSTVGKEKMVIVSRCSLDVEEENVNPVVKLPRNIGDLDKQFCNKLDRTGKLCGKCKSVEDGISVFSGTFKCVSCKNFYYNMWKFFAVSFLFPTIFFVIIIIFHIGVTSAPANGFIFFSQVITVPLQVLLIDSGCKLLFHKSIHTSTHHMYLTNILLDLYRLWSLDFTSLFTIDTCLNPHLKVIEVLAIRYISAVYPIIVLLVAYTIIELHARNCRIIVCLWKPFCFLCVKLRRQWKAKNSIIDAFATFILLSYTKFIRVSITILTSSNVYTINSSVIEKTVSFDPLTVYFSRDHLPYAALAFFILATFGALPPLLLLLYPFRWFQRCLSHCKLQSNALRAFVDAFQGCYKDGRNGGPDRRYFAGIYFIFRIIIFTIYTISESILAIFTELQTAYVVFLLTIVILRPYKKTFYNFLDGFFFAILAVSSGITMYIYTILVETNVMSKKLFFLTYAIQFIPSIYMVTYVVLWLLMKSHCFKTHCVNRLKNRFQRHFEENIIENQVLLDEDASTPTYTTSELPDRLENPDRYESAGNGNNSFEGSTPQWASEQTTLRGEMAPIMNYGSAVEVTY